MAHILVIDDDDLLRGTLKEELERDGYSVTAASDGRNGLASLRADPPDLVITDIFMPDSDGIELIREIRKGWPSLGIIAISGSTPDRAVDFLGVAGQLGVNQVLRKPFRLDAVRDAIAELLQARGRAGEPIAANKGGRP